MTLILCMVGHPDMYQQMSKVVSNLFEAALTGLLLLNQVAMDVSLPGLERYPHKVPTTGTGNVTTGHFQEVHTVVPSAGMGIQ